MLFYHAERSTGLDSGKVSSAFSNLEQNLSGVGSMERELTDSTDKYDQFYLPGSSEDDNERRGTGFSMIANVLTKNIIVRFFQQMMLEIPEMIKILALIISLVAITISVLLLRFFWGDNKI